jgi:uncharacterized protein YbjQ (UPF0145 family)
VIELVLQVGVPVVFFVVFGGAGWYVERRDERQLVVREAAVSSLVVTNLRRPPFEATSSTMVVGHVVIGAHYGKQLFARVRNLVGGEMRAYDRVIDRARREALVRLQEQAVAAGATTVVNLRFATSMLGSGSASAEVICSGTALLP